MSQFRESVPEKSPFQRREFRSIQIPNSQEFLSSAMFSNGAFSAEKGYDLRTPHNVPMGEIRSMRYVEPFSPSSLQKNTIVYGLGEGRGFRRKKFTPPLVPPEIKTSRCTYAPKYDVCTRTYYLGVGSGFTNHPFEANVKRLTEKKFRIK